MQIEDNSQTYSEQVLKNATEFLRSKLVDSNEYIIISAQRQDKVLEMKKASYKKCYDKQCRIELGQALSADRILLTKITKFMGQFTISSEIIDLAKEATIKGASTDFKKKQDLRNALFELFQKLSGQYKEKVVKQHADKSFRELESGNMDLENSNTQNEDSSKKTYDEGGFQTEITDADRYSDNYTDNFSNNQKATVTINGNGSNLKIFIDNTFFGYAPVSGELFPGEHTIRIKSRCFETEKKIFTVRPGEKKVFDTTKIPFRKKIAILEIKPRNNNNQYIKANILINGKFIGVSPKTVKVPVCFNGIVLNYKGQEFREKPSLYTDQKNVLSPVLNGNSYLRPTPTPQKHVYKRQQSDTTIEVFGFIHPSIEFSAKNEKLAGSSTLQVNSSGGIGLGLSFSNLGISLTFCSFDMNEMERASLLNLNLYYYWSFLNMFDFIEVYAKPIIGIATFSQTQIFSSSQTGLNLVLPLGMQIKFDNYYVFSELGYRYISVSENENKSISVSAINLSFGIGMYY